MLLAELDRRRGWQLEGHRSRAHWLAFRTGIDLGTAREKLRAARASFVLPKTGGAMADAEAVGPDKVLSVPDAVGQAIERYLEEKEGIQEALPLLVRAPQGAHHTQASSYHRQQEQRFLGACPECGGGQMAYEEGCMKCHICGYSECG